MGSQMAKVNREKIAKAVKEMLVAIGENPDRPGIKATPQRVARLYEDVLGSVGEDPAKYLVIHHEPGHEEMVIVKNIPLYAICEHHLLPFTGRANVVYIPAQGRVTGLSKIARVVDSFAKRPQVQERMTTQIAECLMKNLKPQGVLVVIEAEHLCMSMRGVKKPGSTTVTSAIRGIFLKNQATRSEALSLIKG